MTLPKLIRLASAQCGSGLTAVIQKARKLHESDSLTRREMDRLAPATDQGSIVNLLSYLKEKDGWDDAIVLARFIPEFSPTVVPEGSVRPVLTLPAGTYLGLPTAVLRRFDTTLSSFRRLLGEARSTVVVVAAFTHPSAVDVIGPDLVAAAQRGVSIRFITQEAYGTYDPEPTRRALLDALEAGGVARKLSFQVADLGAERSMHAKIIVVDGEVALIGSANFTGAALADNVEAGVVVRGETAKAFNSMVEILASFQG